MRRVNDECLIFRYESHSDRTNADNETQVEDIDDTLRENSISGLRQLLIENLISSISSLRDVGGKCCIPFMQVIIFVIGQIFTKNIYSFMQK